MAEYRREQVASDDVQEVDTLVEEETQLTSEKARQSAPVRTSRMALYTRRFLRNKPAVVACFLFVFLVLCAVVGPLVSSFSYEDVDFTALGQPPSAAHWFGTSIAGQDLFAQVMHGVGRSLIIAVSVAGASTIIASFVGAMAAYSGGKVEKVILALIHFLLIIPSFLILAMIGAFTGGNWIWLIVVLIAFGWMQPARVIWQLSMSVREREYISAARYMGIPGWKIVLRHIVPNIGSWLILQFTLGIVSTVMSETGLSFLGFGVKPPDASLGTLLSDGSTALTSLPWTFFFPAGFLTLLTISVALVSDGLRDALDPNSAAGGRA